MIVCIVSGCIQERDWSGRREAGELTDASLIGLQLGGVLFPKLDQRAGACPNHARNAGLGAISFIHTCTAACVLVTPRGQRRSTKMRVPSDTLGRS